FVFFFQAEDGIRDFHVTGVQTCALPISSERRRSARYRARCSATMVLPVPGPPVTLYAPLPFIITSRFCDGCRNVRQWSSPAFKRSEERRVGKERRPRGSSWA